MHSATADLTTATCVPPMFTPIRGLQSWLLIGSEGDNGVLWLAGDDQSAQWPGVNIIANYLPAILSDVNSLWLSLMGKDCCSLIGWYTLTTSYVTKYRVLIGLFVGPGEQLAGLHQGAARQPRHPEGNAAVYFYPDLNREIIGSTFDPKEQPDPDPTLKINFDPL